jgi:Dictyostelium (slime mold) repeat
MGFNSTLEVLVKRLSRWITPLVSCGLLLVPLLGLSACGDSASSADAALVEVADVAEETELVAELTPSCLLDEPCDDGDPCTTGDRCDAAGQCQGEAADVDDGLSCTEDGCDSEEGVTHALMDGWCRIDGVCWATDQVSSKDPCAICAVGSPEAWAPNPGAVCDDLDPCTVEDRCVADGCEGTSRDCDDGNACTFDSCDASGCTHEHVNIGCDDGDLCTDDDRCEDGVCQPGTLVVCDDENGCTIDSCDPLLGCLAELDVFACDDGNPCTVDSCDPDEPGSPEDWCSYEAIGSGPCEDGDACTLGDVCVEGACVAGGDSPDCEDDNPCTDDACLPEAGCVNAFNEGPCDDGVACTDVDSCSWGVCVGEEVLSECAGCVYGTLGETLKSTGIQMGSDGKAGSGLDVDDDPTTCAPVGKCDDGVNNALALLSVFINPAFQDGLETGEMIFIIDLIDPTVDGAPFRMDAHFGVPHPSLSPDCPIENDDCIYALPSYNFKPSCAPKISFDNATIEGGILRAGGKDAVFPLVLPFTSTLQVEFAVLWAQLQGTVTVDADTGAIVSVDGIVGGAVPKDNLYETIEAVPQEYFPIDKDQVLDLLDATVDQDIDLDGDGVNDASSIGFRFNMVPAEVQSWQ